MFEQLFEASAHGNWMLRMHPSHTEVGIFPFSAEGKNPSPSAALRSDPLACRIGSCDEGGSRMQLTVHWNSGHLEEYQSIYRTVPRTKPQGLNLDQEKTKGKP